MESLQRVKLMNIHFVCTGNSFRSRIAEAYLNSKKIPNFIATSSGIEAPKNLNGDITKYTKRLLINLKLLKFTSATWTQTTRKIIEKADFIVFMKNNHLNWIRERLSINPSNYTVFNVYDISKTTLKDNLKIEKFTLKTYEIISLKIDRLINELVL